MNILTLEAFSFGQKGSCQRSLSGSCETPLFHLCLLLAQSFWGCCARGRLDQALTVNVFRFGACWDHCDPLHFASNAV